MVSTGKIPRRAFEILTGSNWICFKHFLWNLSQFSISFLLRSWTSRPYRSRGITKIDHMWPFWVAYHTFSVKIICFLNSAIKLGTISFYQKRWWIISGDQHILMHFNISYFTENQRIFCFWFIFRWSIRLIWSCKSSRQLVCVYYVRVWVRFVGT